MFIFLKILQRLNAWISGFNRRTLFLNAIFTHNYYFFLFTFCFFYELQSFQIWGRAEVSNLSFSVLWVQIRVNFEKENTKMLKAHSKRHRFTWRKWHTVSTHYLRCIAEQCSLTASWHWQYLEVFLSVIHRNLCIYVLREIDRERERGG